MAKLKRKPGIFDKEGRSGDTGETLDEKFSNPPIDPPQHKGSAPTPQEAETVVAQAALEKETEPAIALKPSIPLKVWAALSGVKPDRMAGFIRYAQREGMRACPVTEWRERYEAFCSRPTK